MISEEGKSPHLCAVLARCESIQLSADGAIDNFSRHLANHKIGLPLPVRYHLCWLPAGIWSRSLYWDERCMYPVGLWYKHFCRFVMSFFFLCGSKDEPTTVELHKVLLHPALVAGGSVPIVESKA